MAEIFFMCEECNKIEVTFPGEICDDCWEYKLLSELKSL